MGFFMHFFLYLLVSYGLVSMVVTVVRRRKQVRALAGLAVPDRVILVRNAADFIEGLVRELLMDADGGDLIVIDQASADDTPAILYRLSLEYSRLVPVHAGSDEWFLGTLTSSSSQRIHLLLDLRNISPGSVEFRHLLNSFKVFDPLFIVGRSARERAR